MLKVFNEVYEELEACNCNPKLYVLDIEYSKAIKNFILTSNSKIQLVEPHNHRVNTSETSVKTAKYHLLAALAMVDPACPLQV